jgi:hypothetical protein
LAHAIREDEQCQRHQHHDDTRVAATWPIAVRIEFRFHHQVAVAVRVRVGLREARRELLHLRARLVHRHAAGETALDREDAGVSTRQQVRLHAGLNDEYMAIGM